MADVWTHDAAGFAPNEDGYRLSLVNWSVQATVVGTGAVTADLSVQVSNDLVGWVEIQAIALSDSDLATNIYTVQSAYRHVRVEVEAITGTGAEVTVSIHEARTG